MATASRSPLASPRLRRRLLRLGIVVVVLGGAVGGVLLWGDTDDGQPGARPVERRGPVAPARPERQVVLGRAEREAAIAIAGRFIRTAVAREHVADSWPLVHPELRQGLTREQWSAGEIPIVPYPVDAARWRLGYSTTRAVGFEVLLQPRAGSGVRPMVFDIELRPAGAGQGRRWLVSSWVPRSSGIDQQPPPSREREAGQARAAAETEKHVLGAVWLIVPIGVLAGTLLVVPVLLVVRDWRRRRLGERRHREHVAARAASRSRR